MAGEKNLIAYRKANICGRRPGADGTPFGFGRVAERANTKLGLTFPIIMMRET